MMRAALAVFLALLLAMPAWAQTGRIAILYSSGTTNYNYTWINSDALDSEFFYFWKELGLPKGDLFNTANPTWGTTPTVQAWFEANYDAIVIPYLGKTVVGGGMEDNFSPRWGPLSGRWNIPVYVMASMQGVRPEDEDSTGTSDDLRNGTVITQSRIVPSTGDSLGTHAYKVTSYMRNAYPNANVGGTRDTLYTGTLPGSSYMSISSPYFPDAYIEPILVIDTTYAGLPAAYAGEKLMLAWRWRPDLTKPGVTYCHAWTDMTSAIRSSGALVLLELLVRDTGIKPKQKITMAATDHNYGESNNATLFEQYLAAMRSYGMFIHALSHGAPCDYVLADTASWRYGRQHIAAGYADWAPYSNQTSCGGVDWTWADTLAADTAQTRSLYNKMVTTLANPDSAAFPMSAYNPKRLSPGNGIVGNLMLKVAVDAGCELFDNGTPLPANQSYRDYAYHRGTAYKAAIRGDGDPRRIWIGQTQSLVHPNSFTQMKSDMGAATKSDAYAVWLVMNTVEQYTYIRGSSLFWHSDISTGGSDPYWSWIVTHPARFVASFPNIMEWERRDIITDRRSP